jgi:hypothetical protein
MSSYYLYDLSYYILFLELMNCCFQTSVIIFIYAVFIISKIRIVTGHWIIYPIARFNINKFILLFDYWL